MVTIYSTPTCTYCKKAKEHFVANGIAFTEIDVVAEPEKREELLKHSGGAMAVPVIVVGETALVGWDLAKFTAAYEKES
jgi:glutaredoxin-like YruB-family protein